MLLLLLLLSAPAELAVDGYRPLSLAVEELERRHGWNISYEEGVLKAPLQGSLRYVYAPGDGPQRVLEGLVAAAREQGQPGRFEVERLEGTDKWVVVMREMDGLLVLAPLDVQVDLKGEYQPLAAASNRIKEQVSAAVGIRIAIGSGVGGNFWLLNRTRVAARDEPARLVLERLLRTFEPGESAGTAKSDMVWHMYCGHTAIGPFCSVNTRRRHGAALVYPFSSTPPPPPPR